MGTWKTKKIKRQGKMSQTEGKIKAERCQTNAVKKFYLCHPHAYRLEPKQYDQWTDKLGTIGLTK